MTHWLGPSRLPMIVVDARSTLRDRRTFSARAAGIIGMSTFGRDHFYALDDDMRLDRDGLAAWLSRHAGSPVLIFGFTFMVWEHLLKALSPGEIDLRNAVLIHSGGWKKLAESRSATPSTTRARAPHWFERVHNFYGMAEQIGSVFVKCEDGAFTRRTPPILLSRSGDVGAGRRWGGGGRSGRQCAARELPGPLVAHRRPGAGRGRRHLSLWTARQRRVDPRARPRAELRGCSDTRAGLRDPVTVDGSSPASLTSRSTRCCAGFVRSRRAGSSFDPFRVDFSDAVSPRSSAILGRGPPPALAAAFWLRRAAVSRLAPGFGAGGTRLAASARPCLSSAADQHQQALIYSVWPRSWSAT